MSIQPFGDRILVKVLDAEQTTKSGIVLPDSAMEKQQKGTVLEVGSGKILDNGQKQPVTVKKDDTILFAKYAGTEVKLEGQEYLILKEDDILAVIE